MWSFADDNVGKEFLIMKTEIGGKLVKVKKHVIIEGSDHGTIIFYRDVISKEVDEFLS